MVFRSERPVLPLFPLYIMSNGTYARIKTNLRYPPFKGSLWRPKWMHFLRFSEQPLTPLVLGEYTLQAFSKNLWESQTNATSVALYPPGQAIWKWLHHIIKFQFLRSTPKITNKHYPTKPKPIFAFFPCTYFSLSCEWQIVMYGLFCIFLQSHFMFWSVYILQNSMHF